MKQKSILVLAIVLLLSVQNLIFLNGKTSIQDPLETILIDSSTDIITGKITSSKSYWINGSKSEMIYSIVEVDVDSILKQSTLFENNVIVGFWGGKINENIMEFVSDPYGEVYCEEGDYVKIYARNSIPKQIIKTGRIIDLNAIRIERMKKDSKIELKSTPTQQEIHENQWVGFEYDVRYWDTSDFPIHYRINANTTDCTGEYSAVSSALAEWESDALSDVDYTLDGTCSIGQFSSSDDNAIFWQSGSWFTSMGIGGAVGYCKIFRSSPGRIYDFDIALNDAEMWTTDGSPSGSELDVETIALHEAGHILYIANLDDTFSSYVMTSPTSYGLVRRSLQQGDKEGVRHIYPDSSYPQPTVSITSPSANSHVSSPCGIYATASVSGTTINNVKYRVTEILDPDGYDTGWVSMTLVGDTWSGTWSFTDQNIEYYITVKAETAQGQMGYDWIEVYD